MSASWKSKALLPLLALGLSAMAGCIDEKIVFRDRELFEEPLASAGNFLGYSDVESQLTVCGNCHVEKQGEWIGTAHADAWAGLQGSGHAQTFCEGCHTVGQLGNTVAVPAGHEVTGEARYQDVQCEACHGPGLTHVTDPKDSTVPLAPLNVGVGATQGCGECHSGAHQPFVEEWVQSRHGDAGRTSFRTREDCAPCHGGKGALDAWGIKTEYLEKDDASASVGITCAVCHSQIEQVHKQVIEGRLWEEEPNKLPACVECHSPHKTRRAYGGDRGMPKGMKDKDCLECHGKEDLKSAAGDSLFVDEIAYSLSAHNETACAQCHAEVKASLTRPCETMLPQWWHLAKRRKT